MSDLQAENRRLREALERIKGMFRSIGGDVPDDPDCPHPGQIAREVLDAISEPTCKWRWEEHKDRPGDVDHYLWYSECGVKDWGFNEGAPPDNGMAFCHKCGKKLKEEKDE